MPKTCTECGTEFHGRADAKYCGAVCRQRAHRKRGRPYTAQPYTNTEPYCNPYVRNCTKQSYCEQRRLHTALNIMDYDPHYTAHIYRSGYIDHRDGAIRGNYRASDQPRVADEIDQLIEWLSVIRDGLRGMNQAERIAASVKRCGYTE